MDDDSLPAEAKPAAVGLPSAAVGAPLHQRLGDLEAQKIRIRAELERASRYGVRKPGPKDDPRLLAQAAESPDGKVIVNPVHHLATISRMMSFLSLDLQVHQQVYDVDRAKEYLARISGIVGGALAKIDQELHAEVIEAFKALNREFGIGADG